MEFGRERYLKQLLEREHNGLIKVITGMRRSGKSFLMNELFYRILIRKGISEGQIIPIRIAFSPHAISINEIRFLNCILTLLLN